MLKLMLNLQKFNNYGFFCPVSKVHLTVSSPVGYASEVTPAILKAVKASTVIDVDGKIDLETGTIKSAPVEPAQVKSEEPVVSPTEDVIPSAEEESQEEESKAPEAPEQPAKTTKRGGRKKESAE